MRYIPLWWFPLSMVALNVTVFVGGLLCEGRLKPNVFQYIWLYAGCIPAAKQGNLDPFFIVLST
jgi:hypothetical protein